jgi:hypothetical protein
MRVARHHRIAAALGAFDERRLHGADVLDDFESMRRTAVQPHIRRDLIVPAACCVQLGTGGADALGQLGLDVHVDVFQRLLELKVPVSISWRISSSPLSMACCSSAVKMPALSSPFEWAMEPAMSWAKPPVKRHRFSVALHESAGFLGKAAFPHKNSRGAETSGFQRGRNALVFACAMIFPGISRIDRGMRCR